MQHDTSRSRRVVQVVDCGLWNDVPLLFHGCEKLLDIGGNWNMLSYTSIQSIPHRLNGRHIGWVCRQWKNWEMFSFQELCTDPNGMGPCIIMLKHEVMDILPNSLKQIFVQMDNFWDLLFQLMKHGTNTLHVAFIFLFSVGIVGSRQGHYRLQLVINHLLNTLIIRLKWVYIAYTYMHLLIHCPYRIFCIFVYIALHFFFFIFYDIFDFCFWIF